MGTWFEETLVLSRHLRCSWWAQSVRTHPVWSGCMSFTVRQGREYWILCHIILGDLPETWVTLDNLSGAIVHFCFWSTSVKENAAVLFCRKAPEMFCGPRKFTWLHLRWWLSCHFWVNLSFKLSWTQFRSQLEGHSTQLQATNFTLSWDCFVHFRHLFFFFFLICRFHTTVIYINRLFTLILADHRCPSLTHSTQRWCDRAPSW